MRRAVLLLLLLAALPLAGAQEDEESGCAALVEAALERAGEACSALDDGEVCYGHPAASAAPRDGAEITFDVPGDRAALNDIIELRTDPLDLEAGEWGIAVVQTPEALALLMGEAALSNAGEAAFDFNAAPGAPACPQAPNALVLQTEEDAVLHIGGMRVESGATLVFTLVDEETANVQALAVTLIHGEAEIYFNQTDAPDLALSVPGETAAVTLNDEGRVDSKSRIVPLPTGTVDAPAAYACANAAQTGLIREVDCGLEDILAQQEEPTPGTVCTVSPAQSVNRREGPGTGYRIMGALDAGEEADVIGQATGTDGFMWWELEDESWVREDIVEIATGACIDAPTVQVPPPPSLDMLLPDAPLGLPTPCGPEEGLRSSVNFSINNCAVTSEGGSLVSGERVTLTFELGRWTTEEKAAAALEEIDGTISVDGVALRTQTTGVQPVGSGYGASLVAEWIAVSGTHDILAEVSNGASVGCMVGVR